VAASNTNLPNATFIVRLPKAWKLLATSSSQPFHSIDRSGGTSGMTTGVKAPSGRTIWKAVRDELMLNLYPLPFTTIAPAVYHVYLHPDDFEAVEPIAARIVGQIQQALTAEVEKMNRGLERPARRVFTRLLDREELPAIELPAQGWQVYLRADRDGDLEPGQLGIVSTIAMPAPAEYAGTPTTRIVRSVVDAGRRTSTTTDVQAIATPPAAPALSTASATSKGSDTRERAKLSYEDEQGPHVFIMRKDAVSIGRGGSAAWVDVGGRPDRGEPEDLARARPDPRRSGRPLLHPGRQPLGHIRRRRGHSGSGQERRGRGAAGPRAGAAVEGAHRARRRHRDRLRSRRTMNWLYWLDFVFLAALCAVVGWLFYLARSFDGR
jgi:hypothetical protein